jgi:hypothetical protein
VTAELKQRPRLPVADPLVVCVVEAQKLALVLDGLLALAEPPQRGGELSAGAHVRPGLEHQPQPADLLLEDCGRERALAGGNSLLEQLASLLEALRAERQEQVGVRAVGPQRKRLLGERLAALAGGLERLDDQILRAPAPFPPPGRPGAAIDRVCVRSWHNRRDIRPVGRPGGFGPAGELQSSAVSRAIDQAELEAFRAGVRALLEDTPAAAGGRDVALIERLGLGLLAPFHSPDAQPGLGAVVVEELERRGDHAAAGLLGAIAAFAHEPLAAIASGAVERLRERGIVSPVAERIGAVEPSELRRAPTAAGGWYLIGILARPGSCKQQLVAVRIEPDGDRELIADGLVMPPARPASVRRLVRKEVGPGGSEISAADALARLRKAAGHTAAHGLSADQETADAVALLARALGGDARAVASIPRKPSEAIIDIDPAEGERTRATVEALLAEFASFLHRGEGDQRLLEHIDLVWSLLDWKANRDGRLGRWSVDDLRAFLLEFCPLAVPAGDRRIAALPDCVLAFLRFLASIDRLAEPRSLERLERAVARARARFEREMRDPGAWGFAKSVAMVDFPDEGVDPQDRRLIDRWLKDALADRRGRQNRLSFRRRGSPRVRR